MDCKERDLTLKGVSVLLCLRHGALKREHYVSEHIVKLVRTRVPISLKVKEREGKNVCRAVYLPEISVELSYSLVVGEGDTLSLGAHTLTFVTAPMVHWPEVIVTYDSKDKVLFSADGFGKFGALDADEPWADEARRYYIGIVGKYGAQVQALLKKAATLDIEKICPLHGPVLTENLDYYLNLYNI